MHKDPKCGVYKITNKENGMSYIGVSNRIKERWNEHKRKAFNKETYPESYEKALYRAFRKHGLENFDFEILLECSEDIMYDKEIEYIAQYDSYNNGYNETPGGDGVHDYKGEKHHNSKLTEIDIINIRERYYNFEDMENVFNDYKERVSLSGFKKVFYGYTWTHVKMDVYDEEHKQYFKSKAQSRPGVKNGRSILTEEETNSIIDRIKNGEGYASIYKDYNTKLKSRKSIQSIWRRYNERMK